MSETGKPLMEKNRAEAFSDGVFAIAITLLILELKVPVPSEAKSNRELIHALLSLWPSFLALFTSFATILVMWVNHHGIFSMLHRIDNRVLFANGLLLFVVTVIPFPTALLAAHLTLPTANVAATVYCATYILVNISYNVLLASVRGCGGRIRPEVPGHHLHKISIAYRISFFVYLAATIVAWFHALAGTLICSVLWILWARLDYTVPEQHHPTKSS